MFNTPGELSDSSGHIVSCLLLSLVSLASLSATFHLFCAAHADVCLSVSLPAIIPIHNTKMTTLI